MLGAIEAIKDIEYLNKIIDMIIKTREKTKKELKELGFTVLDSSTNFLFIIHESEKTEDIFKYLKEAKILVRYFKKPRLENGLRVTIGTEDEMNKLIQVINKYLKEEKK